jgi:hypothetical protein
MPAHETRVGSVREGSRLVVLRSGADWGVLVGLLLGGRDEAVVVLARSVDGPVPALPVEGVRDIVGPRAHLVYVPGCDLRLRLRGLLGRGLAVAAGSVRVYWPGLSAGSDPGEHPLVPVLPDEPERAALAAFRLSFDLSRCGVRQEIALMEDVFARGLYDAERLASSMVLGGGRRLTSRPQVRRGG